MNYITASFKRFQTAGLLSVAACALLAVSPATASTVIYNNAGTFLSHVAAGYGLETFDELALGPTADPTQEISVGPWQYVISVPGDSTYVIADTGTSNHQISTTTANFAMTFTFQHGMNAVGGDFFLTDDNSHVSGGVVTVTVGMKNEFAKVIGMEAGVVVQVLPLGPPWQLKETVPTKSA